MQFGRNAVGLLLTSSAKMPLALLNGIVLARFLSVDDRGLYSVATTLVAVMALFANLGWEGASIYRLRRVGSRPAEVASAALLAVAVVSIPLVLAFGLLESVVTSRFLHGARPIVFYLALAIVPLQLLALAFSAIARGIGRFVLQNTYQLTLAVATAHLARQCRHA